MRAKPSLKRELPLDPMYNSRVVTRLINRVMQNGKKTVAQDQIYKAFEILAEKNWQGCFGGIY